MRLLILIFYLTFNIAGYGQTADDYIERGVEKFKLKDYTGAINEFTKSIQIDVNNEAAYIKRALAKKELEDYRGAIADFTEFISLINNKHSYNNKQYDSRRD